MKTMGRATPEGTQAYRNRLGADGHFRRIHNLWISSIGIGTYLGQHDILTDDKYREAIVRAVELGCNVIDSAINYRFQRSERCIRAALETLFQEKKASREEIVLATKGGFLTFDSDPPRNPTDYFTEAFIKPGIVEPDDIVAGCHCMSPRYLEHQLEQSRENLGLECIDIYYVHNPETQLEEIPRKDFYKRLLAAFEQLEKSVAAGKIQMYGTATWDGFRAQPDAHNYLSLDEIVDLARTAGGDRHHFKVVQLPYSLAMPEAFTLKNQKVAGKMSSLLEAASQLGIAVMTSASIMQGRLARRLPPVIAETLHGLDNDAQRAIQFVRSTPGVGVALVGMSQVAHVEENLKLASISPIPKENLMRLFSK